MEERRSEANIVFGLNSYRELCGLHFGGMTLASPQLLIKCASQGAKRANAVVQLVQRTLEEDSRKRFVAQPNPQTRLEFTLICFQVRKSTCWFHGMFDGGHIRLARRRSFDSQTSSFQIRPHGGRAGRAFGQNEDRANRKWVARRSRSWWRKF